MRDVEDEISLWNQFRDGDDKAFARLFELYADILFRYGTKFLNDEATAKDCVQELFIKLFQNRKTLAVTDNVRLYLFRALKNKIIDYSREEKPLTYLSPQELQFSVKFYFDPEESADIDETLLDTFKQVLHCLSDRQKEAIYLRYQMGLSYEEISQLLQIKYQSARNLIHRTIQKIRKEMGIDAFIMIFYLLIK